MQIVAPSLERQPSIRQHMDVDGLTLTYDPRQDLLNSLLQAKDQKIRDLEQMLNKATEVIRRQRHLQTSPQLGGTEDMVSIESSFRGTEDIVSTETSFRGKEDIVSTDTSFRGKEGTESTEASFRGKEDTEST